jgi:hypothetical protein
MSNIVLNTSKLILDKKLDFGQRVINMGEGNVNVPGNTVPLAAFSTAQAELNTAKLDYEEALKDCEELLVIRNTKLEAWNGALTCLAGFTENATQGVAAKILSAGFDVRAERTPPQPLAAPSNVKVQTNGSPGVTKLSWKLSGADSYVVQCSMTPEDPNSWEQVLVTTKTRAEVPGAEPGKICWFRVAGVNAIGQGPWCTPAQRPVM